MGRGGAARSRSRALPFGWLCAIVGLIAVAVSCSSSGTGSNADVAKLVNQQGTLSQAERTALQQAVIKATAGHVFKLTNTVSVTVSFDVQYGSDGRVEFTRTSDPVNTENQAGTPIAGNAVAVDHYTGQPVKECSTGEDRGEKVVIYDNLFGNDYISLATKPRDVSDLRIAIDDETTKDLGYDATAGGRRFDTPSGGRTATIWISPEGKPIRTTTSDAPTGFYGSFSEKQPQETLAPTPGLTPPDCLDSKMFG